MDFSKPSSCLNSFQLNGICNIGTIIGEGAYGVVKELNFQGTKCVGKKIHCLLYEHANPKERSDILQKFEDECELLSQLHHPHIVQFLGVHFGNKHELPMLVVEYLPISLSGCLAKYGVLPTRLSYSILHDIALGLRYLHEHSPQIIHRDLSANNVLLTNSMSAKISDLGVANIIHVSTTRVAQKTQIKAPGTPVYMPPEAIASSPKYTSKVDIFSFGVLVIHILSGELPIPVEGYAEDPKHPGRVILAGEYDRRHEYIEKIKRADPLLFLIQLCLSNIAFQRPSAAEVECQLRAVHYRSKEEEQEMLPLTTKSLEARVELRLREVDALAMLVGEANTGRRCDSMAHEKEIATLLAQQAKATAELQVDRCMEISVLRAEQMREIKALQMEHCAEIEKIEAKVNQRNCEVERLRSEIALLTARPTLKWKRACVAEMERNDTLSAVTRGVEEKVYVKGDENIVYQYSYELGMDTCAMTAIPVCPVSHFTIALYMGKLLTIGGYDFDQHETTSNHKKLGQATGKVYQFAVDVQTWEEFLPPMPTPREQPTVVTVPGTSPRLPAIAVCGGCTSVGAPCSTVEVFTYEAAAWHTAEPLPVPCYAMTATTINDICYLLGGRGQGFVGISHCFSSSLDSLFGTAGDIDATSSTAWRQIPSLPQILSTAANLGGYLVAVGGRDQHMCTTSTAVYVLTEDWAWERVRGGDLPGPRCMATAASLPSGQLLVVGGSNGHKMKNTLFMSYIKK